eukprot:scaffold83964_cov98-Phaeocystis_antarctica.AAC.1
MSMPSFRACASSPRKRIASGEKPPQTSLMSTSTSCPPSSAAWYLAVRGAPSWRGVAEVLLEQPRARRAEGLGRTTKQLGCVKNDGVVDA